MIWTFGSWWSRLGAVDGSVGEPVGWRASALTGLGLGAPAAGAVLLFANMAADGLFAAAMVWLFVVPVLAGSMLAVTGFEVGRRGWPLRRCWLRYWRSAPRRRWWGLITRRSIGGVRPAWPGRRRSCR
jgi:hypothetical protein